MGVTLQATTTPKPSSEDDTWRQELQRLVAQVGVATGSISITLHEGVVTRIVVKSKVTVPLPRGGRDPPPPGEYRLCVRGLDRLIAEGLGQRLRRRIGRFGELRVLVKQGELKEWRLSEKHR